MLLATEGRPIPRGAVEKAAELARAAGAPVHVFAIARIYGVAFGLPSPWLRPNASEWQEQRDNVAQAIELLEQRGVQADANILGTRKATKRIVGEAKRLGCDAIVMGADPPRNRAARRSDVVAGALPGQAALTDARAPRRRGSRRRAVSAAIVSCSISVG